MTPTAHPAPFAARAQALASLRRRRSTRAGRALAGPGGLSPARAGHNRRRMRPARAAPAAAGWVACAACARQPRRPAGLPAGRLAPIGWEAVCLFGGDLAPREIDLVRGLQRHRGGSGRAGAGLAVGHSHPGAGLTAGDAFMAPSSSPARAHVRTCHFYDISRLCEIVRVVTVSGGCPNASYVRLICFP